MKDEAPPPITSGDRLRVVLISLGLFFLFSLLVVQYYNVQILEGEKWARIAHRQHYFIVKEPFMRGTFYSNTSIKRGHPEEPQKLVVDIQKFHLHVDPVSIPESLKSEVADNLARILDISGVEEDKLVSNLKKKSRHRILQMWLTAETKDEVLQWWLPYAKKNRIPRNALYAEADYQRSYPFGKMLGAVLHTVQDRRNEVTGQGIPTGGLELQFNKWLEGRQGARKLMRSPRSAFEIGEVIQAPENGADVYLSINHVLQAIAEEELSRGVRKAKAIAGWAVMMDPKTGEILALAQYPFFYPASYAEYFNDPNRIDATRVKAVTDAIEPGSIMKAMTSTIALQANKELSVNGGACLFDPEAKMPTADGSFPGRKPLKDFRVYPYLNLDMALQASSNIYFARLTERITNRLGAQWYRSQLCNTFGFGRTTGIELPGESAGVVPTPGKKHANGTLEWSIPTPFSLAIGHNIQANSIQILRAFAVLANGGKLVQPTLVRKVVKQESDGHSTTLVDNTSPERVSSFPQVADSDMIARVVKGLKYVTQGKRCDIAGYTQAGKTGTAEKIINGVYSKDRNVVSFVGFAPLNDPVFVLIVSIDEPEKAFIPGVGPVHYGGFCAAPIFREIGRRTLEYLGVAPDDPYGYPQGDPRYDPEKADWVKEMKALKQQYEEWNTR
ncbi:MAG: penicillin-binding protein 2 [Nitrosomonas sp.]|nr:MAG: penicillin-binding protein 2 [Nitrosomonas sp.]